MHHVNGAGLVIVILFVLILVAFSARGDSK